MSDVYEVVDATDDETYYTIGVYSMLDKALEELNQPAPPETYNCHRDWCLAIFEVRKRPIDAYSEHGKYAATVTWDMLPLDDNDEEEQWERKVTLASTEGEG